MIAVQAGQVQGTAFGQGYSGEQGALDQNPMRPKRGWTRIRRINDRRKHETEGCSSVDEDWG